ncbi:hypothetical protein [Rhizobium sp. L245/93]|uniref:hypothetical protein n=1 Tax=Rhizobium sp. L245/93 TaxID=2819998 RepID=UPI001ADA5B91|nr:hypothetical protein [Rhizobium sp. L245/93]MBO9170887.1 hypothetical protein [Rhizobium sp. L245/93]
MFKDRIIVRDEKDYDGETIKFFNLNDFPYPDDLEEVHPFTNPIPTKVPTQPGQCFVNALKVAKYEPRFHIVFGYFGKGDNITAHCFVRSGDMYFDVTPGSDTETTRYFEYYSVSLAEYMAELKAQLGDDMRDGEAQFPISVDENGKFIFVRVTPPGKQTD